MAHYLLTGNLEPFVASLGKFGELGYAELPRHCQEAVLIYASRPGANLDLPPQAMSERTVERFRAFSEVIGRHGGDLERAAGELARAHRNTYFYYYLYALPQDPL